MPAQPKFQTERSRPDGFHPSSLRLGFFGQPFYYQTRRFWQARHAFIGPSCWVRPITTLLPCRSIPAINLSISLLMLFPWFVFVELLTITFYRSSQPP